MSVTVDSGPAALVELLQRERAGIVASALDAVGHLRFRYESTSTDEIERRLELLYDYILDAVTRRNPGPIVAYANRLARQRFEGGYGLSEVQAAFNTLEEAVWERVVADLEPAGVAEALALVSTIFGVAKDTLACGYVAAATRVGSRSLDLESLATGLGSA
jgi:hypothetical protein